MAAKSKKKTGRKQTKKKKTEQSFLGEEIFVWVTLAVSILLLISNFGFGGNIGYHVSGALKARLWDCCLSCPIFTVWNRIIFNIK